MASDVGPGAGDEGSFRGRDGGSRDGPRHEEQVDRGSGVRSDGPSDRATAESSSGGPTALPSLSVVVPTYNEEDRVEACLESILAACGDDPTVEVILVDSNSTDRTVELARRYPVTVLRIPDDDLTTPGAGRYVGQQAATGDHLLFVDGDMRLSEEWLERARDVVHRRDDVAGVDGHLNTADATTAEPVDALRGVVLYDADALGDVGGFDPFLQAVEDIELGFRIDEAGYDVRRLPVVAAAHSYTPGASELLRRWRNGYYFGIGQAVRKNLDSPRVVRKFAARYRYRLAFYCWLALGVASALVQPLFVVAWLACTAVLFAADAAWEGRDDACQRFGKYTLSSVGFVRGFCMRPRDHDEFPVEAVELVAEPDPVEA